MSLVYVQDLCMKKLGLPYIDNWDSLIVIFNLILIVSYYVFIFVI